MSSPQLPTVLRIQAAVERRRIPRDLWAPLQEFVEEHAVAMANRQAGAAKSRAKQLARTNRQKAALRSLYADQLDRGIFKFDHTLTGKALRRLNTRVERKQCPHVTEAREIPSAPTARRMLRELEKENEKRYQAPQ